MNANVNEDGTYEYDWVFSPGHILYLSLTFIRILKGWSSEEYILSSHQMCIDHYNFLSIGHQILWWKYSQMSFFRAYICPSTLVNCCKNYIILVDVVVEKVSKFKVKSRDGLIPNIWDWTHAIAHPWIVLPFQQTQLRSSNWNKKFKSKIEISFLEQYP